MVSRAFLLKLPLDKHVLTCLKVNELSGTIDLDSTIIRAEALFRRFQRLVEAVDKRNNFPPPRTDSPAQPNASDKGKASTAASPKHERVITPELRKLLSRKVETLDRKPPKVALKADGSTDSK
jgi:hypothetical protein